MKRPGQIRFSEKPPRGAMRALRGLACALVLLSLGGCFSFGTVRDGEKQVDRVNQDIKSLGKTAEQPATPADVDRLVVKDDTFLTSEAIKYENGERLPSRFMSQSVTIARSGPMTLFEVGAEITQYTGLPVEFSDDALDSDKSTAPAAPASIGADSTSFSPLAFSGVLPQGSLPSAAPRSVTAQRETRSTILLNETAKLPDILNRVASRFNITWEYRGGRILFFRNVTETFHLAALAGKRSISNTLSGESDNGASSSASSGASGSTGGGANAQSSTSSQLVKADYIVQVWDEVKDAVTNIVGKTGTVSSSASIGTITVTAPREVVRRVDQYIGAQNKELSRQVALSVKVLNVSLSDHDELGLNLNAMFKNLGGWSSLTAVGPSVTAGGSTAIAGSGDGSGALNFAVLSPTSSLAGSTAAVNALSTRGDVSVVTSTSQITLNHIPVPVQVTETRGYLARSSTTNSGTISSTQQSLEPGSLTTGFTLNMNPSIQEDGKILMNISINVSEFQGFTTVGQVSSTFIQVPTTQTRAFDNQFQLRSGSTLVLGGFEQLQSTVDKRGTIVPDNFLFGGGKSGDLQRFAMVVLITPVVIDISQDS